MGIVLIKDAKPGMILFDDVIDFNTGVTILTSGAVLNKKNILNLKKLGFEHINTLEAKEDYISQNEGNVEYNDFLKKHDALSLKTRSIFNNIKIGKKIIISEVSKEVDDVIDDIVKSSNILSRIRQLEEDNDYTFKHSINVSILATMVGKWLNYSRIELKQLSLTGLFHDIGKLKITGDIINKPDRLTKKEYEIVKKHTVYGYNILCDTVGVSKNVAFGALQHHERENGKGYPLRLKSNKIHEFGKIIAICDIFDAMTSKRVYKDKVSPFKVAEQITEDSFGVLDPRIALVFLNNISKFYVGNIVKLSNGEVGEIVYVYKQRPTRPTIKTNGKYIDLLKQNDLKIIDIIN